MNIYSILIGFGRSLHSGIKFEPHQVIGIVNAINNQLHWTPVEHFFELFPPVKRYEDDGSWDYHSTLKLINENYGERFGKDDFLELLMTSCYENKYIKAIGLAYMMAISELRRRKTGISMFEEFTLYHK